MAWKGNWDGNWYGKWYGYVIAITPEGVKVVESFSGGGQLSLKSLKQLQEGFVIKEGNNMIILLAMTFVETQE
jgi:hypothetical protein